MVTNFFKHLAVSLSIPSALKLKAADLFEKTDTFIPGHFTSHKIINQNIHNHVNISSHIFSVIFMLKFLYNNIIYQYSVNVSGMSLIKFAYCAIFFQKEVSP